MQSSLSTLLMMLGAALLGIIGATFWVVAIVDVINRPEWDFPNWRPGSNVRTIWMFVVLLANLPGSFAYYLLVMKARPRKRR